MRLALAIKYFVNQPLEAVFARARCKTCKYRVNRPLIKALLMNAGIHQQTFAGHGTHKDFINYLKNDKPVPDTEQINTAFFEFGDMARIVKEYEENAIQEYGWLNKNSSFATKLEGMFRAPVDSDYTFIVQSRKVSQLLVSATP